MQWGQKVKSFCPIISINIEKVQHDYITGNILNVVCYQKNKQKIDGPKQEKAPLYCNGVFNEFKSSLWDNFGLYACSGCRIFMNRSFLRLYFTDTNIYLQHSLQLICRFIFGVYTGCSFNWVLIEHILLTCPDFKSWPKHIMVKSMQSKNRN